MYPRARLPAAANTFIVNFLSSTSRGIQLFKTTADKAIIGISLQTVYLPMSL